jgi:NADPH2:quinone reductase
MKAIRFAKAGGPEVLEMQDIDLSPPRAGEVRVKHTAIGVNFIDTYQRSGLYPVPLPSGLGLEAAGVVESVGENVTTFKKGDRIAYCTGPIGSYAECNNVPAERVVKLPACISEETAAASLLKGMTAQYLLKRTYAVKHGETIVFHAAAGGVGLIACQWAKHLGAVVIGTVGSDEKTGLAKENGCTHVLNSRSGDWSARVREISGGDGVPVVYDGIGRETFMASLDCLAVRGMLVSFGNASGAAPPFEPGILSAKGSLYLTRPTLFHYTRTSRELQETAEDLFSVIESGAVKVAVHQRFPLSQARRAHEALHARATTGATLLIP